MKRKIYKCIIVIILLITPALSAGKELPFDSPLSNPSREKVIVNQVNMLEFIIRLDRYLKVAQAGTPFPFHVKKGVLNTIDFLKDLKTYRLTPLVFSKVFFALTKTPGISDPEFVREVRDRTIGYLDITSLKPPASSAQLRDTYIRKVKKLETVSKSVKSQLENDRVQVKKYERGKIFLRRWRDIVKKRIEDVMNSFF